MEEEYGEWEETLVVAELSGLIDSETLKKDNLKCEVLGIDTDRPVLQIENYVFAGEYEDAIGTSLIFKGIPSDPSAPDSDLKDLEYLCSTRKKLVMKRAFLQSKDIAETAVHEQNIQDEDEVETEGRVEEGDGMEADTDTADNTDRVDITDSPVASTSGLHLTQASSSSRHTDTDTADITDIPVASTSGVHVTQASSGSRHTDTDTADITDIPVASTSGVQVTQASSGS